MTIDVSSAVLALVSLVNGDYSEANNSRGDEFATYKDFERRYLEKKTEGYKLAVFTHAYDLVRKKDFVVVK